MAKKLSKSQLNKLEARRDVWQEVLDGVKEIKAGGCAAGCFKANAGAMGARKKRTLRCGAKTHPNCRQAS